MPLSILTFPPNDTLITPIITQLSTILTQQIGGITTIYTTPPAGPPDDSSVVIMLMRGSNNNPAGGNEVTIGRLRQRLTFVLMHHFRFNDITAAYNTCYSYIPSYLQALEDWANQRLNEHSLEVNVKDYGVAQHPYAGQPYLVLGVTIEVVTEIPTPVL